MPKALEPSEIEKKALDRAIFFSDGVFAIAVTLLALDVRLPQLSHHINNATLVVALADIFPKYFSFVLSFLVVGGFWIGHHRKFSYVVRSSPVLIRLNLLLLLTVAFVPFASSVLSEFGSLQSAVILYAGTIIVVGLASAGLWKYIVHHPELLTTDIPKSEYAQNYEEPLRLAAVFALSIVISFWDVDIAKWSWLLVLVATRDLPFLRPSKSSLQ